MHLQGLVKHSVDHIGVGDLVEELGSLKGSQPLAGFLRSCWHRHIQIEQDGQEVLGIARKNVKMRPPPRNVKNGHLAKTARFSV